MKVIRDKVIVQENGHDGIVNILTDREQDEQMFMICLKQGPKFAHIAGDMELIMSISVEPGQSLSRGHIVTKERFTPWIEDNPLALLKMKNGRCCRKDGKVIYSYNEFTYNNNEQDVIIEEDPD